MDRERERRRKRREERKLREKCANSQRRTSGGRRQSCQTRGISQRERQVGNILHRDRGNLPIHGNQQLIKKKKHHKHCVYRMNVSEMDRYDEPDGQKEIKIISQNSKGREATQV